MWKEIEAAASASFGDLRDVRGSLCSHRDHHRGGRSDGGGSSGGILLLGSKEMERTLLLLLFIDNHDARSPRQKSSSPCVALLRRLCAAQPLHNLILVLRDSVKIDIQSSSSIISYSMLWAKWGAAAAIKTKAIFTKTTTTTQRRPRWILGFYTKVIEAAAVVVWGNLNTSLGAF